MHHADGRGASRHRAPKRRLQRLPYDSKVSSMYARARETQQSEVVRRLLIVSWILAMAVPACTPPTPKEAPSLARQVSSTATSDANDAAHDRLRCPDDAAPKIFHAMDEDSERFVRASCVDGNGSLDGPYREITWGRPKTQRASLLLGQMRNGYRVGQWSRVLVDHDCDDILTCGHGTPAGEQTFDDKELLDGQTRQWSDTGQLVLDAHYAHGVRSGGYRTWYPSGRPRVEGRFADDKDPKLPALHFAEVETYLLPGSERRQAPLDSSKKSVPVGVWRWWGEDGALSAVRSFDADGNPEGRFCRRQECTEVTNGTGDIDLEYGDKNGLRGRQTLTLKDRRLEGTTEDRRIDASDGGLRLVARSHFRHGQLHGVDEAWDERGKLQRRQRYRDGVLDGPSLERSSAGDVVDAEEITTEGQFCNGLRCGRLVRRSSSGAHEEEVYAPKGSELPAAFRRWDKRGVLVEHGSEAESRRYLHAQCLAALQRGECCEHDVDAPPNAPVCRDGPPPSHR